MKCFVTVTLIFLYFFAPLNCIKLYAQQRSAIAANAMTTGPRNYTTFTTPDTHNQAEAIANNPGYEQNPEVGVLYVGAPCANCYELIGSRTENSKTFVKQSNAGKDIFQQTSTAPMHYRDSQGNWRTVKTQLTQAATGQGIFAAAEQEAPVLISPALKTASLGKADQFLQFDNDLELVYAKPDGTQQLLGTADYSHYTAGDDGVYITNAWPGIDIEMFTLRGAIKTNFWINKAMPEYAAGQLLVRDHMQMADGLSLFTNGQNKYTGNLEVRNDKGEKLYAISAATAFERANAKSTLQMLEYYINANTLDIALPGNFLNRGADAYPVIIDPLVSIATTSTVTGTTYSPAWTTGCVYTNLATVPAKVTVTDVQFTFQYVTSGGALLSNGAFDFKLGTCRSPTPTTLYWNCNSLLTGTCTGTDASIFPSISACVPPPQCTAYNLDITMNFYQDYLADAPCSSLYITAGSPLTITVIGHTIETSTITASATTLCGGQTTTLSATSTYGVPPYTDTWTPGGLTGTSVTVSPAATTTYTVTATDACGGTASATQLITVDPLLPITGSTTLCVGANTTLSDVSVSGGIWSAASPTVLSINASTGVVNAFTAGTTTVSFTTPAGCTATTLVTVKPVVAPISGLTNLCIGGTTILTDAATGGTWNSSTPAVAGITGSGVVSGLSSGTSVITYATPGVGCAATTTVSVNVPSPITGNISICAGSTSTLADASGVGTWSSSNPAVATIGAGTGIVSGITGGTSVITFSTATGCYTTTTVNVIVPGPITGTPVVCQGNVTTLANTTTGGTWSSGSTGIATVGPSTGVVTGMAAGVATISYLTPAGCQVTTVVTVNAVAPIAGGTNVCAGSSIILTDGTAGGTWSSSPASGGVATIGAGTGVVSGISAGSSVVSYLAPTGCSATATITVSVPSPITGGGSVCQGSTLALSNATPGGTWNSSSTAVATISPSSGTLTGIGPGVTTINYSVAGGCNASIAVTVNPLTAITGAPAMCLGSTTTLSDATPGGTWSSATPTIATVSATGLVTSASVGTGSIQYTTPGGCVATTAVFVNTLPSPISGSSLICSSATMSDVTPGGVWTSTSPSIATIDPASGVVTGITTGTTIIYYTMAGGCNTSKVLTVNPIAPITGTPTVCQGNTTALAYPGAGGSWSSLSPHNSNGRCSNRPGNRCSRRRSNN